VPRGAARDHLDPLHACEQPLFEAEVGERGPRLSERQQRLERLGRRPRLLVDLLEHEVPETAALHLSGVPVEGDHRALHRAAPGVDDPHLGCAHRGQIAVLEVDTAPGQCDHRGRVGGDQRLAVAETDHQRRPVAEGDQRGRGGAVHGRDRELAGEPAAHGERRRDQVRAFARQQVGDRLGVGVGREARSLCLEFRAQLAEVLDDPVVDHRDARRLVGVGVGVALDRRAVGRPARVAEREVGPQTGGVNFFDEVDKLALGAHHGQGAAGVDRESGRVVAAILETAQRLEHDRHRLARADITDDAAHEKSSSVPLLIDS
jgi:hypothetical protein